VSEDLLRTWVGRLDALRGWNPLLHLTVLTGFNANTDLVRRVDEQGLRSVIRSLPPEVREELQGRLSRRGSTEVLLGPGFVEGLLAHGPFEERPGGQAALVGELLSGADGHPAPVHGEDGSGKHFVFEFGGSSGGRLILSCSPPLVPPDAAVTQRAVDAGLDAAFLAGFHRMAPDAIRACTRHLLKLRAAQVPIHLELTAMGPAARAAIPGLVALSDSLGGSEAEVRDLLGEGGEMGQWHSRLRTYAKENLLARIHVHLDGVQMAVTDSSPEEERRALLLASKGAAEAARFGTLRPTLREDVPFREEDIARYAAVVDALGGDPETGFVGADTVLVPSPKVESPARVVGLGDILSAVAFLARSRHLKGRAPDGIVE